MFDSLSNLMEPRQKHQKQATSTVTKDTQQDNTVNFEIPTFDIAPIDFKTIDDQALVDYLDQNEQQLNQMLGQNQNDRENMLILTQNCPMQIQQQRPQIPLPNQNVTNYQINNIQNRPMIPAMYFPNSTVTNFQK